MPPKDTNFISSRLKGKILRYIRNAGAFYMRSGKNCFHPKGQTTLVVPSDEVLAWASEHPRGEFGHSTYRHGLLFTR